MAPALALMFFKTLQVPLCAASPRPLPCSSTPSSWLSPHKAGVCTHTCACVHTHTSWRGWHPTAPWCPPVALWRPLGLALSQQPNLAKHGFPSQFQRFLGSPWLCLYRDVTPSPHLSVPSLRAQALSAQGAGCPFSQLLTSWPHAHGLLPPWGPRGTRRQDSSGLLIMAVAFVTGSVLSTFAHVTSLSPPKSRCPSMCHCYLHSTAGGGGGLERRALKAFA